MLSPLIRPPEQVVVHCGSGVTAYHTLLALDRGIKGIGSAGAKPAGFFAILKPNEYLTNPAITRLEDP